MEINKFGDILRKTIKNEAKKLHSDNLSHTQKLDLVSRQYGFETWNDLRNIDSHIILIFRGLYQDSIKVKDNGFKKFPKNSNIKDFIFNQEIIKKSLNSTYFHAPSSHDLVYFLRNATHIDDLSSLSDWIDSIVVDSCYPRAVVFKGVLEDFSPASSNDEDFLDDEIYFDDFFSGMTDSW